MIDIKQIFAGVGIAAAIFNITDAITTFISISLYAGIEGNPFMSALIGKSWFYFFFVKITACYLFLNLPYSPLFMLAKSGLNDNRSFRSMFFLSLAFTVMVFAFLYFLKLTIGNLSVIY